jgi:hypothetical protein
MRNAFFLLLLILISPRCLSQDSIDIDFIERQARRLQSSGEIYYSDYAMKDYSKIFERNFNRRLKGTNGDTLFFSKSEEKYLRRELRRTMAEKLPDNLFPNSTRKKKDSIVQIVEALNRSHLDSLRKVTDKIPRHAYVRYWAFSFSRPVYIRNGEWMVFYLMYYANSVGAEDMAVYKRGIRDWELWGYIGGGAW